MIAFPSVLPLFLVLLCFPSVPLTEATTPPSSPKQADPARAHMKCENCSIVLENLWEGQKRRRNRVQWWRWLGNQIHGSASKGTGSLCSAYWSARNIAGLLGIGVNPGWYIMETLHCLHVHLDQSANRFLARQCLWHVGDACWLNIGICCVLLQTMEMLDCLPAWICVSPEHFAWMVDFGKFVGFGFLYAMKCRDQGRQQQRQPLYYLTPCFLSSHFLFHPNVIYPLLLSFFPFPPSQREGACRAK